MRRSIAHSMTAGICTGLTTRAHTRNRLPHHHPHISHLHLHGASVHAHISHCHGLHRSHGLHGSHGLHRRYSKSCRPGLLLGHLGKGGQADGSKFISHRHRTRLHRQAHTLHHQTPDARRRRHPHHSTLGRRKNLWRTQP